MVSTVVNYIMFGSAVICMVSVIKAVQHYAQFGGTFNWYNSMFTVYNYIILSLRLHCLSHAASNTMQV